MKSEKIVIDNVLPDSIAAEAGIEPGDCLISVNSQPVRDVFDYRFLITDQNVVLEIEKKDGEIWEIDVEKDEYEDLGIEFENPMMDEAKSCTNKCIFCFIDQLPKGMRDSLYFKDDDTRLSFLMGNYITLTNIDDEDIDRIIKYRMSPINVSVHTTNPDLRAFMLKNRFAGNVMERIRKMVDAGITVNCQIVLCRYINDRKELHRTISELSALYPGVRSISVVPVGITKHREGLCELRPYDKESARELISQMEEWQERLLKTHGSRIVYVADELYIMARMEIPSYEHYEDFPQIENGVGLTALLKQEFDEYLSESHFEPLKQRCVSIATGVSSYGYIKKMISKLEEKYDNIKIYIYKIKNNFFGKNVTVTGLITGGDLISQLKGQNLGSELLICKCMLKSGESIFLDDYTVEAVEKELNIRIQVVENSGEDFIEKVMGTN